jgi:phospholipid/cholesterol/gamma-HCH transport system substrate-binding protein
MASFKNLWYQALVGILVIGAIGFVGYYTIFEQVDAFSEYKFRFKVRFHNVEGLRKGAKVRFLGVDMGRVKKMEVVLNEVFVEVAVLDSVPVYSNYQIEIRTESALGGKYVSVYPGNKRFPLMAKNIDGQIFNGVSYRDPFTSISQIIDENRTNVYETIRNVKNISSKINTGKGTFGKLVNDDEAYSEMNTLIKRAENLMGEVREGIEDSREQAPVTSFLRTILTVF